MCNSILSVSENGAAFTCVKINIEDIEPSAFPLWFHIWKIKQTKKTKIEEKVERKAPLGAES